ncbi:TonB-dependent receptor [Shewanella corallii]|uniref:TonB-dependent receptor n=1 Tax=Shewanella corallii TaxID=560080 RepID=A0ABT0N654_9GAMM|nr:TonB-dependent receptor [Shewanella corallii]MCL2913926.1 TonB-dependent receptor [Shewanella corallii]
MAAQPGMLDVQEVIVVHGTKPSAQQLSASMVSLSGDELERKGFNTLAHALEEVPGINVRFGGKGVPQIDIRGYKSRHVTFLLNGVPMNDPYESQFDPQLVPVEQIQEVQITVGGSASLLYGSGANGGVINVITKQGTDLEGAAVQAGFGNDDSYKASVSAGGASGNIDFFGNYVFNQRDDFALSSDFMAEGHQQRGQRTNSDARDHSVLGSLGWQANEETRLGLNLNYRQAEWGIPDRTTAGNPKFDRLDDMDNYSIQGTAAHQLNEHNALRGFVYYTRDERMWNSYEDENFNSLDSQQHSITDGLGANLQWVLSNDNHMLTTSLGARSNSWESETISFAKPKAGGNGGGTGGGSGSGNGGGTGGGSGGGTGGGSGGGNGGNQTGPVYLDETINQQDLVLEYQYQSDRGYGATLSGALYYSDIDSELHEAALASAYWQLSDNSRVFASAAKRVRYPDLRQLYEAGSGNADLQPETSWHYEVGLVQYIDLLELNLTAYTSDIDNYIEKVAVEVNGEEVDKHLNFDKYRFSGVDTSVRYPVTEWLEMGVAYSYLDAENLGADSEREQLQGRPKHTYKADVRIDLPLDIMLFVDAEHARDSVQYQGKQEKRIELDNYTVVNLGLTQKLPIDGLSWQLKFNNLLDENYSQSQGLPRAGREWMLSVNYSL